MVKKKDNSSPAEMLQKALVPEWEQPYQIPENWVWVKFGSLADDIIDGPFGSNLKSEHYTEKKEARIIQLSNIGEDGWREENTKYTSFNHANTISRSIVSPGDIIIAKMMPAGRAIIVPTNEQMYVLSSDTIKVVPTRVISTQFLVRGINCTFFRNQVQANAQGITRARTSISKLKEYAFPLPPFTEQRRIIDRIESLFSKLDDAKEKVQYALDSFQSRKAAILFKAFTGELTKKWRKENNIVDQDYNEELLSLEFEEYEVPYDLPLGWKWLTLNKCCTFIGSGVTPKGGRDVYAESGIEFIRSQNVLFGKLDLTDVVYITDEMNQNMKRTKIVGQETLLNITGASIGRACYVPKEQVQGNVNQHVCVLRFKDYVNNKYPSLWLISPAGQRFVNENQIGQTRQALNYRQLRGMYIPIPTPEEQTEIVHILDSILEKELKAKELSDVIEKIDLMKKAILARAFRGELGTNDPFEESAKKLLKSALEDKTNIATVIKEKGKVVNKESIFILEEINVPKTILEVLSEHNSLTPEKLKAQTGIKDIDDFYSELKNLVDTKAVVERRDGDESYLEVNNAH